MRRTANQTKKSTSTLEMKTTLTSVITSHSTPTHKEILSNPVLFHIHIIDFFFFFFFHIIEIDQDLNHFPNTSPSPVSAQNLPLILQTFDSPSFPCPLKSTNLEREDPALLAVELITISLRNKANHFRGTDSHQTFRRHYLRKTLRPKATFMEKA